MFRMSEQGAGGRDETDSSVARAETTTLLEECRLIADRHVGGILQRLFQATDDQLFDLSDRCAGTEERNQFLEAVRLMRLEQEQICRSFKEDFARRCREFSLPPTLQSSDETDDCEAVADDLSLVNEYQLEETLAVDNLIAKIHDHFHDVLFGLEHRFAHLLPDAAIDCDSIPFGPEALCRAFQEGFRTLNLDIRLKIYIYKILDRILMMELDELYHELNQCLIDHGILPRLKIRVKKAEDEGRGAVRENASPSAADDISQAAFLNDTVPAAAPEAVPIQAQMFQALQYLLHVQFDGQAEDGQEAATATLPLVTPLLVDTLSDLQRDVSRLGITDRQPGRLKEQVRQRFDAQEGGGGARHINQLDDETIDVISMIFDYILDDKSLPDFIKAMIARLQIPVLKVAIMDRRFFSRKDHPARQLLNELAYAGLGWVEESEAAKDRLYEKMEAIVLRILREFDNDIAIFDELLAEFRAFIEEEKQRFDAAQERIREETALRERVRKETAALVAGRLEGSRIPPEVRDFLLNTWRQVLVDVTLRHGPDSAENQKAVQVMDDLIWSLSPEANGDGRRRLLLILPLMLDALREGLQHIGFSDEEIEDIMDMLGQHHLRVLKPEHHDVAGQTGETRQEDDVDQLIKKMNADIEALPELEEDDIMDDILVPVPSPNEEGFARIMAEMGLEEEVDNGPRIEDEHTDRVRSLALGTWVELVREGTRCRAKLAWKGDEFTSYTFMNRQCQVVAELPLYTLAEEFRRGRARIIEDVALFDRALDGVISGIMRFAR